MKAMRPVAQLPLDIAEEGPLFDRRNPHDHNDRVFAAWEAPLVWHHQPSVIAIDSRFNRQKAIHFAFEQRVPEDVWSKGWHLWYDNAVLLREQLPPDVTIEATLALEEQTAGFGGDNVDYVRPWSGIVARMQDLRRYYYLALEFPDAVSLYRRDDRQWTRLAFRQTPVDVWTPYRLRLECRGNDFRAWLDDEFLFRTADYAFGEGWAGVRATCTSFATALSISAPCRRTMPSAALPHPRVVADIDLAEHGVLSVAGRKSAGSMPDERYNANIRVGDFAGDGRDTIVVRVHGRDKTHLCIDASGNVLWEASLPSVDHLTKLPSATRRGIDLVGVSKDSVMLIHGATGQVLRRAAIGKGVSPSNCPTAVADFDGTGKPQCFFLHGGANDHAVWAYDSELNLRWTVNAPSGGGHGQHISVCDVNGDGRDEIFHGCALWNHNGTMVWQQDDVVRRLKCPNGGHVDASAMGFFDGPDAAPTVHMAPSSAGHLVADARIGELLAAHPQGHVQSCTTGRVIPGAAGTQVLSTNRWGSYGVTGIYSGDGRRLARFQPGFVCQSTQPILWVHGDVQHLLVADGPGWRGIYDHTGRRVVDLDPFVPYADSHRQRYDRVQAWRLRVPGQATDGILLRLGTRLRILSPES